MKRIRRFASIILALVMIIAMSMPTFAVEDQKSKEYSITVKQNAEDKTEHTFKAYQIFKGDLATKDDGSKVLSNIEWGSGVNGDALLSALKADKSFGEGGANLFSKCKTAADVAAVLGNPAHFTSSTISASTLTDAFARAAGKNLNSTAAGTATGTGNVTIKVTGPGYYMVQDFGGDKTAQEGAYSRFMLEVVGNAEATVKSDVPHGTKEVYTDAENVSDANYASIGSHVTYKITSEVPNHVGYNYYYFIMNDTLSDGLTLDYDLSKTPAVDTFTVQIFDKDSKTLKNTLTRDTDYYVYTGDDASGNTFRLAFADITKYSVGDGIVVTYSATVNDKAKIGIEGNSNKWKLQYSNNPNTTFDKERPDGKPGLPLDESTEVLGETPEDITLTYVTELDITKYLDEILAGKEYDGAEFTLTGASAQVVAKGTEYYEESASGTYYLLKDGTYTTDAPAEDAYEEIGTGDENTTEGYISVNGSYIIPADKADYVGETIYKKVDGTNSQYVDIDTKYEKKTATGITYNDMPISMSGVTADGGKLSFKGLGEGTYTLTETITPAGYNTMDPITITITFKPPVDGSGKVVVNSESDKCQWEMTGVSGEGEDEVTHEFGGKETGIFTKDIVNKAGSLLPSTGGIGTTIFYVVGGILVVGAVVLLVTKKRMSKTE